MRLVVMVAGSSCGMNLCESGTVYESRTGRCMTKGISSDSHGSAPGSSTAQTSNGYQGGTGVSGAVNCFGAQMSQPCSNQEDTFEVFAKCRFPVRLMCDSTGLNHFILNQNGKLLYCVGGSMFSQRDRVLRECNPTL